MNPNAALERIRQVVNGGGPFSRVDAAREHVPTDPVERSMYEFLARLSSDTQHVTDFAGAGLGILGYLSGTQNQAVIGRYMHGGQDAFNVLYQNRAVGITPSPVFAQQAAHMARLSKLAKGGGVLLTAFGVAVAKFGVAV